MAVPDVEKTLVEYRRKRVSCFGTHKFVVRRRPLKWANVKILEERFIVESESEIFF